MGDQFQHVRPGEDLDIPAPAWNAVLDATRAYKRRIRGRSGGGPASLGFIDPALTVRVVNRTSEPLGLYAVLSPGGPAIAPDEWPDVIQDDPSFDGFTPTTDRGPVLILQTPLGPDETGPAAVLGVTWALVDGEGEYAAPVVGETGHMAGGDSGPAYVLWRKSGTGPQIARILIGGVVGEITLTQFLGQKEECIDGDIAVTPFYTTSEIRGWGLAIVNAIPDGAITADGAPITADGIPITAN